MKFFKFFILCTLFLFSVQNTYCLPEWLNFGALLKKVGIMPAGTEAAKELGKSGATVLKEAGTLLTEHGETIKEITQAAGVEASKNFLAVAAKEGAHLGEKFVPIAWLCAGVYATHSTCTMVCEAKDAFTSSNKDKSEELQYGELCTLLKAKKELRESLAKNEKGERGVFGLPVACEDAARKLVLAGGANDLEKITADFKKWYGDCPC